MSININLLLDDTVAVRKPYVRVLVLVIVFFFYVFF